MPEWVKVMAARRMVIVVRDGWHMAIHPGRAVPPGVCVRRYHEDLRRTTVLCWNCCPIPECLREPMSQYFGNRAVCRHVRQQTFAGDGGLLPRPALVRQPQDDRICFLRGQSCWRSGARIDAEN